MLESALGGDAPVATDPAPAVGGAPEAQAAGSGTETPKFPGWTGQLKPEQLADIQARVAKDPKALEKLPKGLSELYASFAALDAQSSSALKRPAKDAPKEAWDQFYKELGRPESAEAYTLEKPKDTGGLRYDDAAEKWFRGIAHSLGLTQDQAKGFFDEWNKTQAASYQAVITARKAAAESALGALKQKWGDKFADNWAGLQQAYAQFMPEGSSGTLFKKIQAHGLDNDPDFLQMFYNIYTKIGPPKIVTPSGEGGGSEDKGGFHFKVDSIAHRA